MRIDLSGHYGYKRILLTMIPTVIMVMVSSIYSIVDGLFVSNIAGTTSFAALNFMWPLLMLVGSFGMMIGSGGSALVSKIMGEGRKEKANEIFSMIVKFTIIISVLLCILFAIYIKPIIRAFGIEGELYNQCYIYGIIVLVGIPAFMLQVAFQSLYMTAEKPKIGTIMTIVCGVVNISLDALFMVVFGWGLMGAALATAIAMYVAGLFPLYYFSSTRNNSCLKFVICRIEKRYIIRTCTNGLSEYVGNIALSVISVCYNMQLMKYMGENGIAVYGIIMYISYICVAIFIGYNVGITPIIGYNYGASNKEELNSLLRKSLVIIGCAGFVITLLSEIFAYTIAEIFVGYDVELTSITAYSFRLYMLSFLVFGINFFISAWFTALNNGFVSAFISFIHTFVFEIGFIFLLPLLIGKNGLWIAIDIADICTLIVAIIILFAYRKRYGY
ncbi:MAG: MATE family efflux transporter [Prevotellaceae bacterium]|nr:MATE family efflux transporter [Candidatus Faecinaster equi]